MRASVLVFVALAALCSGCANVCDRMCAAEAELFDSCLTTWETTWAEQGYPGGQEEYLSRCEAVWGTGFEETERNSTERSELSQQCSSRLQAAEADTDCQTLLGS